MKAKTDKRTFIFCALAFASYYVIMLCAIGYATVFLRSAGISEAGTGTIVAVACIVSALLQPVLGRISDKIAGVDWKKVSFILAALLMIAFVSAYFSQSTVLVISFFTVIIFTYCINPFLNESSFYYERNGRHVNFGIVRGMGSLSYALVSYLFQFAKIGDDTKPIVISGIIATGVLIVSLLILPRANSDSQKIDENKNVPAEADASNSFIGFVRQYKVFMIFWVSLIFIMTFQSLFSANLIDIVNKAGGNVDKMGIAIALAAIVEIPVMFLFSRTLKKLSPEKLILVGAFFFIVKSVLFFVATSMITVYIAQVLQMLTYAVVIPGSVYLSDKLIDPKSANTGQTMMGFTTTAGSVFGFFIGGVTMQYGGASVMLLSGVVITVVGFVFALVANIVARKNQG